MHCQAGGVLCGQAASSADGRVRGAHDADAQQRDLRTAVHGSGSGCHDTGKEEGLVSWLGGSDACVGIPAEQRGLPGAGRGEAGGEGGHVLHPVPADGEVRSGSPGGCDAGGAGFSGPDV